MFTCPYGIHRRVVKEIADVTAAPISIIYQISWESGDVLADWKLASVIPTYKKDVREELGNYRHVSLTSVTVKIMKIILGGIERHLKNVAAIRQRQQGFTKGSSCLINLPSFYNKVAYLVDEGKVFLSNSFDVKPNAQLVLFDNTVHSF